MQMLPVPMEVVSVRFTKAQLEAMDKMARDMDMSRAAFLRAVAINYLNLPYAAKDGLPEDRVVWAKPAVVKPSVTTPPVDWASEAKRLHKRGMKPTHIASILRQPYQQILKACGVQA